MTVSSSAQSVHNFLSLFLLQLSPLALNKNIWRLMNHRVRWKSVLLIRQCQIIPVLFSTQWISPFPVSTNHSCVAQNVNPLWYSVDEMILEPSLTIARCGDISRCVSMNIADMLVEDDKNLTIRLTSETDGIITNGGTLNIIDDDGTQHALFVAR